MSGYSDSVLERKLVDLNNSPQSIQQLSVWLIHHRKHYQSIVKCWFKELGKAKPNSRKLTFLYLANDVSQNSKKKHPEYSKEFGSVMKPVLEHLSVIDLEEKTIKAIERLLKIWQDRNIFEPKIQADLSKIWTTKVLETAAADDGVKTPPQPPSKKPKTDNHHRSTEKRNNTPSKISSKHDSSKEEKQNADSAPTRLSGGEIEEMLRNTAASPNQSELSPSSADPPEPEELIKALQDLENSASSDAVVREKIARLPPEVSETSHLEKISSTEEGLKLLTQVNNASTLLNDYNERLQQELKDRHKVGKMIKDFLAAQKDLLAQAEERLEIYRDKLDKVNTIKDDLKSHIQSLPDLTQLPDVTGGLAPLPSAGDLFTVLR